MGDSGVKVSDLIDGASVAWTGTKGKVTGTIKKDPDSVKKLYGADQQSGHFFPATFESKYYSKPVTLGGRTDGDRVITPTAEDPYLIIRLENLSGDKATAKADGAEIFELDFSGATKAEA